MGSVETRLSGLMRAGLAGDAAAYRRLLDELSRHLRAYFLRRLGQDRRADAEDLVQETLIAVHTRRATYEIDRPFTAWLHAIAHYKLVDHVRRQRLRITVPLDDEAAVFADDDAGAAMARRDLDRVLAAAPPRARDLIRQVKIEGRSVSETAAATGLSESAVKVGIHRGLKALAAKFRGQGRGNDE